MVLLTREQGLRLTPYFRRIETGEVVLETSHYNPGNVLVTVWDKHGPYFQFEITPEGRKVGNTPSSQSVGID